MKQRTQRIMRNENQRRLVIGKGSWHLVEGVGTMKPQEVVEGEFINKDKRTSQIKYFRSSHFQVGFEQGFMNQTTTGDNDAW